MEHSIGVHVFLQAAYKWKTPIVFGSISAALSCAVYIPQRKERGLLSRTAAGNRAYYRLGNNFGGGSKTHRNTEDYN